MTDQVLGYGLLGLGAVIVVAVIAGAGLAPARQHLHPPPGVHVPPGSWLPVSWAVTAALLGAALAFKPEDQPANWWFLVPALGGVVASAVLSVRAAGREWHETDSGTHEPGSGHEGAGH